MNSTRRNQICYWALTVLVLLPTAGSGIPELLTNGPRAIVQSYQSLGYPLYLMKILGFAKLLGAVVLLTSRHSRMTEWAYAGFGILFLGAAASHALAGDAAHAPIPLVFFIFLAGSYIFRRRRGTQAPKHSEEN